MIIEQKTAARMLYLVAALVAGEAAAQPVPNQTWRPENA
jgi:hypothetical protein